MESNGKTTQQNDQEGTKRKKQVKTQKETADQPFLRFADISSPDLSSLILPTPLKSIDRVVFASISSRRVSKVSLFDRILIHRFFDITF
jgi:hypothetical protein